jgi:acyl-coenzyme A synthetase/AMP-(fatty) acid ligase
VRGESGRKATQIGWLRVMGHNYKLTRVVTHGLAGTWVEEQVNFAAGGYTWFLTASYEPRFKSLRPTMIRMLGSFKLR